MTTATRPGVAVVGIGCRVPGAEGPGALWRLLVAGGDQVVTDADEGPAAARLGPTGLRSAALLEDCAGFDSAFFRVPPREADGMDPQQRLMLEASWHALEDAGIRPDSLRGSESGVYFGLAGSEYALASAGLSERDDATRLTGALCSITANRLSYLLGLRGPSLVVDTACSSSLVAAHLACRSLQAGEIELALVGGVSLILDDFISSALADAGVLAADGRCKTFDARADGYVRGEGAVVLVLRRLEEARRLGDRIYAEIAGSAVNQDGASNGLTAPSRQAQEVVIEKAYRDAGLAPSAAGYVEAHGTGTLLGDPVEAKALGNTVGRQRDRDRPCRIGSIKTNFGHLEAAAGVAGLAKCCLMLHRRRLVPSLHFETPNPYIPFQRLGLEVQTRSERWPRGADGEPRVASVSSFGIGGTNAHVVLRETPRPKPRHPGAAHRRLLVISAESSAGLTELASRYRYRLAETAERELVSLCRAAAIRRQPLRLRAAIPASSAAAARRGLDDLMRRSARGLGSSASQGKPRLAFVFTGQGSQYPAMARELFERESVFREAVESCAERLEERSGDRLLDVLWRDSPASRDVLAPDIHETRFAQPAIFAVGVGLVRLLESWGIRPQAVLGHSVGELTAAWASGALPLDRALDLVAARGRLLHETDARGAMLAARMTEEDATALLRTEAPRCDLAAVNGPRQVVFAGLRDDLDRLRRTLERRAIGSRSLEVRRAFHSRWIEPVLEELEHEARSLSPSRPSIALYSNVTGGRIEEELAEPSYWARQARDTVRFDACLGACRADGFDLFVEIGPQPALASQLAAEGARAVLSTLNRERSDSEQMIHLVAALYEHGLDPDWKGFFGAQDAFSELPLYPFQRRQHWLKGLASAPQPAAAGSNGEAEARIEASEDDAPAIGTGARVLEHLSAITGHEVFELAEDLELEALGLSSIHRVELALLLEREIPGLVERRIEWPDLETVGEVVAAVAPTLDPQQDDQDERGRPLAERPLPSLEEAPADSDRASETAAASVAVYLAPAAETIRRDERHRVIEVDVVEGRPRARLRVDQQHPFYFDHPYDHVPGALFVEGVQQLVEWLALALGGQAGLDRLHVEELSLRFSRWADPDEGLFLETDAIERRGGRSEVRGAIGGSDRCARFRVRFGERELPRPGAAGPRGPRTDPAPGELVHKVRPENVLISTPTLQIDRWRCRTMPPLPSHALCDGPGRAASTTHLFEAARQLLTAQATTVRAADGADHLILLSTRILLEEPVDRREPILLETSEPARHETRAGVLATAAVSLQTRGRRIGRVEVHGTAGSRRQYQEARWQQETTP